MRRTLKKNICFVNQRKKTYVYSLKDDPDSVWFTKKELYSIFAGFRRLGLISFLIHYRWLVHILCFGCIGFFCVLCLQWMNCTACWWFSWILLFLFSRRLLSFIFLKRVFYCCFGFCTEVRVYSAILWNSDMSNERQEGGVDDTAPPTFLIWDNDASKIK